MPDSITVPTTNIIFLKQNTLIIAHAQKKETGIEISSTKEIPWEAKTLSQVLAAHSKDFMSRSAAIVLGDNLSFVAPVLIDKKTKKERQDLIEQAKKIITQPLDKLGIDWTEIGESGDKKIFQIFAVQKSLLSLIGKAASNSDLIIRSVEPLAFSLSRLTQDKKTPYIVIYDQDSTTTLCLAHHGLTVASTVSTPDNVYKAIQSLISFANNKLNIQINQVIMPKKSKTSSKKIKEMNLNVEETDFEPTSLAAEKEDIFGEDNLTVKAKDIFSTDSDNDSDLPQEKSGEIDQNDSKDLKQPTNDLDNSLKAPKLPLRVTNENQDMNSSNIAPKDQSKSGTKLVIVVITILVVLGGIVGGGVLVYRNATSSPTGSDSQSPLPDSTNPAPGTEQVDVTPSPIPSPQAEIDKSEFSINVLNGSGIAGEAGKVAALLEDADFETVDTGNADSYDFTGTEISVKAGNTALLSAIEAALEDVYEIGDTDLTLDEDSEYDAVITVGTSKASTSSTADEEDDTAEETEE